MSRIALKQLLEIATKYYKKTGFRAAIGDFKTGLRAVCGILVWYVCSAISQKRHMANANKHHHVGAMEGKKHDYERHGFTAF